jgi:hypothetical protein
MLDEERPGDDSAPDRVEIKSISEVVVPFLDRLREANRLFVEGKDAGRSAAIAALVAVTDFLRLFPGATDHQQPFGLLISALLSLDDNNVLPLLKPRRRRGRPYDSAAREIAKAWVVATARWLQEAGVEREVSYSRVAQTCRKAGLKPGRGREPQVTGLTVRHWREEIDADFSRHSNAARTFDRLAQPPLPSAGNDGLEIVSRAFLDELRRALVESRAAEH